MFESSVAWGTMFQPVVSLTDRVQEACSRIGVLQGWTKLPLELPLFIPEKAP